MARTCVFLLETDRFNLSQPKKDCCYGDDIAVWLRGKLIELGVQAEEPDQEDWGWYMDVQHCGHSYFLGIAGDTENVSGNKGEWRLMLEKHRSFKEKLIGKNHITKDEGIIRII